MHQSDELLNKMSEWCVKTHTANGLVDRVKASKLTERAAELQTLDFFKMLGTKRCFTDLW